MAKSSITKIVIIVAALGAAVAIYASTSRPPKVTVVSDARPTDLICLKCNHEFELPYDEFVKSRNEASAAAKSSSDEAGTKTKIRKAAVVELDCPSCNERHAVPANRCPKHKCFYPKMRPDGTKGFCPQCPRR